MAIPTTNLLANWKASAGFVADTSWADQSGNGYNIEATPSAFPTKTTVDGLDLLRFASTNAMTIPAGLSVDARAVSIFVWGRYLGTGNAVPISFGGTRDVTLYWGVASAPAVTDGTTVRAASTIARGDGPTLLACRCSASRVQIIQGPETEDEAASAAGTGEGGYIGRYSPTGTLHFVGDIYEIAVYSADVSDSDLALIRAYGVDTYGFGGADADLAIVCDGDSITSGFGLSTPLEDNYYPILAARKWANQPKMRNLGVSGQTMAQMESDAAAQVDALLTNLSEFTGTVVVAWGGTNDINAGENAETTLSRIWTYCDNRQTAGWKVAVLTILPRDPFNATQDGYVASVNTSIRADWASHADYLIDVAADSRLDDATDLTYFQADGIHLTQAGAQVVADLVYAALGVSAPTVTTTAASSVTTSGAKFTATVEAGDLPIAARGFCWSTSPNPTIGSGTVWVDEFSEAGSFEYTASLTAGTLYYMRAFVYDEDDTIVYSDDVEVQIGAIYYIDFTNGNDSRTDTEAKDPATPWKTVTKFFATSAVVTNSVAELASTATFAEASYITIGTVSNGKTLTVRRKTGDTGTVIIAPGSYLGVYIDTLCTGGDFTFEDVSILNAEASSYVFRYRGAAAGCTATLRLNRVIGTSAAECFYSDSITGNGKNLTLDGCTFTSAANTFSRFESLASIDVNNSVLHGRFYLRATIGTVAIAGSEINGGTLSAVFGDSTLTALASLTISDTEMTSDSDTAGVAVVRLAQNVTELEVTDSIITHTGEATSGIGFIVGNDSTVAATGIGTVTFTGNRIKVPVSHAVLVGSGADSGTYTDNIVESNGDLGIVIKGNSNTLRRNRSIGTGPFLIKNGKNNDVQYNTFYATASYGTRWEAASGVTPTGNIVKNNIIVALDDVVLYDVDDVDYGSTFDYNLYYTPGEVFGERALDDYSDLEAWAASWNAGDSGKDVHSFSGNPVFMSVNPEDVNFLRPVSSSPAVGMGEDETTVGALAAGSAGGVFNRLPSVFL